MSLISHDLRRAAVLGHPIAHSLSPVLHRAAYRALGLPWTYDAVDVTADAVQSFVQACGPEWVGLSLTMPLKEAVLPALTQHSPLVELTRASNTVVFEGNERIGHNTDVTGLVAAMSEAKVVSTSSAAILGSGATARSALVALQQMGAREIDVVARQGRSAKAMAALGGVLGVRTKLIEWADASTALEQPVVISTVPAAVAGQCAESIPSDAGLLFDVIYDPWPTPLASAWASMGQVVGGLDLLVQQACGQIELMTGAHVMPALLRAALEKPPLD